jgi:hypothetical protein
LVAILIRDVNRPMSKIGGDRRVTRRSLVFSFDLSNPIARR